MFQTGPGTGGTPGADPKFAGGTGLTVKDIDFLESQKALAEYSNNVLGAFTQTRGRISEIQKTITDTVPGVRRLGGDIKDVASIISEVALESRRNVIANSDQVESLYAASQVLGLSAQVLSKSFLDVGMGIEKIPETLEESVNYVRSIGGNAKTVFTDVQKNMEQMNRYQFEGGVLGLTKMAAQASMLRFDIATTFKFAEDLLDPDKAIEVAAAFQRLGVTAGNLVDPFQLMNMSINDPSGLQDSLIEISKKYTEFDAKTKTFKINPQGVLTLREIGIQAGLDAKELSKMGLAAAELDNRLSQISPSLKITEEDKQYLANISSMNEGGDYEVKFRDDQGKEQIKKLSEISQTEFEKLIQQQKDGNKTVQQLQTSQLRLDEILGNNVAAIKAAVVGGILTAPTMQNLNESVRYLTQKYIDKVSKDAKFSTDGVREDAEKIFVNLGDDITKIISEGKFSPDEILTELMAGSGLKLGELAPELLNKVNSMSEEISAELKTVFSNFKNNTTTGIQSSSNNVGASVPSTSDTNSYGNISVLGQTGVNPNFSRGSVPGFSREPIKIDQNVKVDVDLLNVPPGITPAQINEIIEKAVRQFKMAVNEQAFKNYIADPSGVY
jgi:hypothetical protein